jgi:hypothetical protein
MNKDNKHLLQAMHHAWQKQRNPSFPEHCIPVQKYNDNSANALTKSIIDFLTFSGFQAERINTMGKRIDKTKTVDTVLGKRQIGSVSWIKGTGTKGSADISATIKGRSVKIEVKYGKDRQSEYQKEYQQSIETAGGVYVIAKDFDSWLQWYYDFIKII